MGRRSSRNNVFLLKACLFSGKTTQEETSSTANCVKRTGRFWEPPALTVKFFSMLISITSTMIGCNQMQQGHVMYVVVERQPLYTQHCQISVESEWKRVCSTKLISVALSFWIPCDFSHHMSCDFPFHFCQILLCRIVWIFFYYAISVETHVLSSNQVKGTHPHIAHKVR